MTLATLTTVFVAGAAAIFHAYHKSCGRLDAAWMAWFVLMTWLWSFVILGVIMHAGGLL